MGYALRKDYAWLYTPDERAAARREAKRQRAERRAQSDGFLTTRDLVALTDRERPTAQARVLEKLRLPFRRRPDGSLIVLRAHVEAMTGSRGTLPRTEPQLVL